MDGGPCAAIIGADTAVPGVTRGQRLPPYPLLPRGRRFSA